MVAKMPDTSKHSVQLPVLRRCKKAGSEEDAVVLHGWADLPHVRKKLGRFARLHGEEELDTLEIGELVACQ